MGRIRFVMAAVALVLATSAGAEPRIVDARGEGVLNLRNGPNWWEEATGIARNGSGVTVLARSNGWVWVQHESGAFGWLEARYLRAPVVKRKSAVAVAPAAPAPDSPYLSVVYPSDGALNLRTGPGTGFQVVTTMTRGSFVEVQETAGQWARLRHESGAEGWAYRGYLTR